MAGEKKKGKTLYRIIIALLILIIAFSAYKIVTILYGYHEGTKTYEQVQVVAGTNGESFTGRVDFDALSEENEDVQAWLYSEDTPINYPVVQGSDNQYYLYRMFNGEWNGKGSLFIDYRCAAPFQDFNTIIYGHRMKDGSMFHSLINYRKKSYFEEHQTMELVTRDALYEVDVFAVVTIPADSELYRFDFADSTERQAYLDQILADSEIDTGVSVSPDDRIVMMSTCTYEFDDARLVVYGKLREVEEKES